MRFEQERLPDGARKAFFLGDGAGVGKVRAPPGGYSLAMQTTSHLIPHWRAHVVFRLLFVGPPNRRPDQTVRSEVVVLNKNDSS